MGETPDPMKPRKKRLINIHGYEFNAGETMMVADHRKKMDVMTMRGGYL